jgi:hypothetical protein
MLKALGKTKLRRNGGKGGHNKKPPNLFWQRVFHPELNRAGDFILKNLDRMGKKRLLVAILVDTGALELLRCHSTPPTVAFFRL